MIANIKYIYDESGEVEAAIVPIQTWREAEQKLISTSNPSKPFQPSKFKGIFSHLDINVEQEIRKMREEWKRNF